MQIGWFDLLSVTSGLGALSNLFVEYFGALLPWPLKNWERIVLIAIVIAVPALANYRGVSNGARLSNVTTVAKLSPLALLILLGIWRFAHQPQIIHASEIASPGLTTWIRAMALLLFAFGGWEDSLVPTGEIKEPRRTIPFGLGAGLCACAVIYMLLQFITVTTIGTKPTNAPLQEVASVFLGRSGAALVTVGALVSIYGWISAAMLYSPRLAYSLAAQGDFPRVFVRLHSRFRTPAIAILVYAFAGWVLASSGTFLYLVAVGSGTFMILYTAMCASLIRLRKLRPNADAYRISFGPLLSVLGVAISVALMTGLKPREVLLMGITPLIATANWLWARRRHRVELETEVKAVSP